jgi:hypothetical protein
MKAMFTSKMIRLRQNGSFLLHKAESRIGCYRWRFTNAILIFITLASPAAHGLFGRNLNGTAGDLKFEPSHGFYEREIHVTIAHDTQYTAIFYTLDGSVPAAAIGKSTLLYGDPIAIHKTSTLRAIAVFSDGSRSEVMTQTYIFVADVVRQDVQFTRNAGFPARWGSLTPDYGMDPDIVEDPKYGPRMKDALLSIPAISLATNIDDLFGSNGIYTNSEDTGGAWERPVSAELLFPDGREGFQIDCGIRIQGGWFRQDFGTKKHSFRLLFKTEYGPSKLRYPLFGDGAAGRFDTIVLRAGANDAYSWDGARTTEQYTRDEFGRRLHALTGNVSPHGMFVHLYLNGIYWGLYNPVERPDDSFCAANLGGDKSDWDVIDSGETSSGSADAWNQLLAKCRRGVSSLEDYMEILGNNPDGTRNQDFPVMIDVKNYIDYMIVNMWGGNWDWPWKNYRITRDRTEAGTGFKFYIWDYENTMGNNRERSPLDKDRVAGLGSDGLGVGEPHINMIKNENYRTLFADRVHELFFNGGPFSPRSLVDHYLELASGVELAVISESARWGDQHYANPLTMDDWYRERDWIINTYIPQRSDIVLAQFRKAGLYPDIDAPEFHVNDSVQHGGAITHADLISITASDGTIYYSLDGSDPRLSSNSTSSDFIIVPEYLQKQAIVPKGAIDQNWKSDAAFKVSDWLTCLGEPGGVGYERESGYDDYLTLDVGDEMYSKNTTCYLRIPFDLGADILDSLASCILKIRYDDGFIAYLNGSEVARRNFTGNPQWNSRATSQNSDEYAVIFEDIDISECISSLKTGGNILAIQGLNTTINSSDFLISGELTGRKKTGNSIMPPVSPNAVEYSAPFALNQTTQIKSRVYKSGKWSALNEAVFTLPSQQNNIVISELHYHPLPQDEIDESEFEFIEFKNAGPEAQNLGMNRFVRGVNYAFPANTVLHPGEYLVLASDGHYFNLRYGFSPFGTYSGQLDNGGEQIVLLDAASDTLISFRYNDKKPWPESADGGGYSLVLEDTGPNPVYDNPASWRASRRINGEPGTANVSVRHDRDMPLPKESELLQNYPNPFNSGTIISFILPQKAFVSITLFNMQGQEVKTLVHREFTPGRHVIEWNAAAFSGGLYFIRMKTNQVQRIVKAVLVK